jgi:hypothetical protein
MDIGCGQSVTPEAESFVSLRVGTPHPALAPYVSRAVKPLFSVFDGYEASLDLIESAVKRLIERKMG